MKFSNLYQMPFHCVYDSDPVLNLQPCIIGVIEVIDADDALYIVMELWVFFSVCSLKLNC